MDRGVWWATVHGIAKSQTWLSDWAPTHTIYGLQSTFLYSKLLNPCKYPINWCCLFNKLCLTLCNPMDHSLLGFSFHVISQARMLLFSRLVVSDSLQPHVNAAHQGSWSSTISQSLFKHMSMELMMPSNHLILCHPLLLSSIFPSVRDFSNESVLHIRWLSYRNFSFSIIPSNEYSGLIFFQIDWFDLLAVQGTLKSLLQLQSSKASILWKVLDLLYGPTLTSICDYWENISKNTSVGYQFLLQEMFPTQGLKLCLLHWKVDSLPLSHLGNPSYK